MIDIKIANRNLWAMDEHGNVFIMDAEGIWQLITAQELYWNIKDDRYDV